MSSLLREDHAAGLVSYLQNSTFSDFTICIGNKKWDVHKLVVCIESEFFKKLLAKADAQQHTKVSLPLEECVDAFGGVLQYMYSGNMQVHDIVHATHVLTIAHRLVMPLLHNILVQHIADKMLTPSTVLIFLMEASHMGIIDGFPNLLQKAVEMCTVHFCDLFSSCLTSTGHAPSSLQQRSGDDLGVPPLPSKVAAMVLTHNDFSGTSEDACNFVTTLVRTNYLMNRHEFELLLQCVKEIDPSDAPFLLEKCIEFQLESEVGGRLLDMMAANFGDLQFEDIGALPVEVLCRMLQSNDLNVESEDHVFDIVAEFLRHRNVDEDDCYKLWSAVRFAFLSTDKLEEARVLGAPLEMITDGLLDAYSGLLHVLKKVDAEASGGAAESGGVDGPSKMRTKPRNYLRAEFLHKADAINTERALHMFHMPRVRQVMARIGVETEAEAKQAMTDGAEELAAAHQQARLLGTTGTGMQLQTGQQNVITSSLSIRKGDGNDDDLSDSDGEHDTPTDDRVLPWKRGPGSPRKRSSLPGAGLHVGGGGAGGGPGGTGGGLGSSVGDKAVRPPWVPSVATPTTSATGSKSAMGYEWAADSDTSDEEDGGGGGKRKSPRKSPRKMEYGSGAQSRYSIPAAPGSKSPFTIDISPTSKPELMRRGSRSVITSPRVLGNLSMGDNVVMGPSDEAHSAGPAVDHPWALRRAALSTRRQGVEGAATKLQAIVRGFLIRRRFEKAIGPDWRRRRTASSRGLMMGSGVVGADGMTARQRAMCADIVHFMRHLVRLRRLRHLCWKIWHAEQLQKKEQAGAAPAWQDGYSSSDLDDGEADRRLHDRWGVPDPAPTLPPHTRERSGSFGSAYSSTDSELTPRGPREGVVDLGSDTDSLNDYESSGSTSSARARRREEKRRRKRERHAARRAAAAQDKTPMRREDTEAWKRAHHRWKRAYIAVVWSRRLTLGRAFRWQHQLEKTAMSTTVAKFKVAASELMDEDRIRVKVDADKDQLVVKIHRSRYEEFVEVVLTDRTHMKFNCTHMEPVKKGGKMVKAKRVYAMMVKLPFQIPKQMVTTKKAEYGVQMIIPKPPSQETMEAMLRSHKSEGMVVGRKKGRCAAPRNFKVAAAPTKGMPEAKIGRENVVLSWNPPADAGDEVLGYQLMFKSSQGGKVRVGKVKTTWTTLKNLPVGTYDFRVSALAVNGEGRAVQQRWQVGPCKLIPTKPSAIVFPNVANDDGGRGAAGSDSDDAAAARRSPSKGKSSGSGSGKGKGKKAPPPRYDDDDDDDEMYSSDDGGAGMAGGGGGGGGGGSSKKYIGPAAAPENFDVMLTPAAPDVDGNNIMVTWEPPVDNGGSPIASYIVEYRATHSDRPREVEVRGTSTTLKGLKYNDYVFAVLAVTDHGEGDMLTTRWKLTPTTTEVALDDPIDEPSKKKSGGGGGGGGGKKAKQAKQSPRKKGGGKKEKSGMKSPRKSPRKKAAGGGGGGGGGGAGKSKASPRKRTPLDTGLTKKKSPRKKGAGSPRKSGLKKPKGRK